MDIEHNCLTTWFPVLAEAGLPVPKTAIVDAGDNWHKMLGVADGPKQFPKEHGEAMAIVERVAEGIRGQASFVGGYPLLLRTGHFSGKHNWNKTCFVPDAESVTNHVCELVVMSEMYGSFGELPWRYWAVREMLPIDAIATLPAYGDFPLVREVRGFVEGGKLKCKHPYWPAGSVREGFGIRERRKDDLIAPTEAAEKASRKSRYPIPDNLEQIVAEADSLPHIAEWMEAYYLLEKAAQVFVELGGSWSVDVLKTKRGWFITDCAVAQRSFHYPGCEVKLA